MTSTPFSILTTERLILRKLSIDDWGEILTLRSDPEINKYLDRQAAKTREDAINFINKVNENIDKHMAFYWAITLAETNTVVGTICLYDLSNEMSSCEIGYELMIRFQGQGIMSEALRGVIDYVFQTLKLNKILAVTHCKNEHSSRLLSKFNFVKSLEVDKENPELDIFILTK